MLRIQGLAKAKAGSDDAHQARQFSNSGKAGHMFGGVSIHEMSSEDIPSSTCTLCTSFLSLHEALQASAGQ